MDATRSRLVTPVAILMLVGCNLSSGQRPASAVSPDEVASSHDDGMRDVAVSALDEQDATSQPDQDEKPKVPKLEITIPNRQDVDEVFKLEIAATPEQIAQGLMGRKEIDPQGGMIFIYPRAAYRSFWMKNCIVDIDLVFLDPNGKVVKTWAMEAERPRQPGEPMWRYETRLKRYRSVRPAQFAIELKKGSIERLGIEEGEVIKADWRDIEKRAKPEGDDR